MKLSLNASKHAQAHIKYPKLNFLAKTDAEFLAAFSVSTDFCVYKRTSTILIEICMHMCVYVCECEFFHIECGFDMWLMRYLTYASIMLIKFIIPVGSVSFFPRKFRSMDFV